MFDFRSQLSDFYIFRFHLRYLHSESFAPVFAVSRQTLRAVATTYFVVQLTSHQTKLVQPRAPSQNLYFISHKFLAVEGRMRKQDQRLPRSKPTDANRCYTIPFAWARSRNPDPIVRNRTNNSQRLRLTFFPANQYQTPFATSQMLMPLQLPPTIST